MSETKLYSTTFSDEFMHLLNSHKLYGYSSKREIIENALQHYKMNYNNNLYKQNLSTVLRNMLLADFNEIENLVLINAKSVLNLDYLFYELFYKDGFNEKLKEDPDALRLTIANAENSAENKIKQIIKEVVKNTETRE